MRHRKRFRGRHKFICDVCGMEYYSEDKKKRWDGAIVCKWDWEPRHPQDLIKAVKEDTSVPDPRPEPPDVYVSDSQYATSATENSGMEGSWLPSNTIPPTTLSLANQTDAANEILLQPDSLTAWGKGSWIELGDGTIATWDGTKWVLYSEDYSFLVGTSDGGATASYRYDLGLGELTPRALGSETLFFISADGLGAVGFAVEGLVQVDGYSTLTVSTRGMDDLVLSFAYGTYLNPSAEEWDDYFIANIGNTVTFNLTLS